MISPGVGASQWLDFQQRGIAAIDCQELGDLSGFASREAIHETAVESGLGDNPSNHSLALWSFAHAMRVGDVLIAKRGRSFILGWGTVTGEYLYDLGPGFQIGHSFFVPDDQTESVDDGWYESVVETQIAPLLREYWFDRLNVRKSWRSC